MSLSVDSALAPTDASSRPGNLSQDDVRSSAWLCFTSAEAQREAAWWSRARNVSKHDLVPAHRLRVGPRRTRGAVEVLDVADAPGDLCGGVGLPVVSVGGHLVPGE